MAKFPKDLHDAIREGDVDEARKIIEAGVDVNLIADSKSFGKAVPLLVAASDGNVVELVKFLLERGADPNARDSEGNPAILRTHGPKCFQLLVEAGADVRACNHQKQTFLHVAAESERYNPRYADMAQLALDRGADREAKDGSGRTPLAIALKHKAKRIAEMLDPPSLDTILARLPKALLKGRPVPPLLESLWRERFTTGQCLLEQLNEAELVRERAEVDEESLDDNAARLRKMAWFAREADGGILGFYVPQKDTPLETSVVLLDNEGQYLPYGRNLAEFVLLRAHDLGEDERVAAEGWLKRHDALPTEPLEVLRSALEKQPRPRS